MMEMILYKLARVSTMVHRLSFASSASLTRECPVFWFRRET